MVFPHFLGSVMINVLLTVVVSFLSLWQNTRDKSPYKEERLVFIHDFRVSVHEVVLLLWGLWWGRTSWLHCIAKEAAHLITAKKQQKWVRSQAPSNPLGAWPSDLISFHLLKVIHLSVSTIGCWPSFWYMGLCGALHVQTIALTLLPIAQTIQPSICWNVFKQITDNTSLYSWIKVHLWLPRTLFFHTTTVPLPDLMNQHSFLNIK